MYVYACVWGRGAYVLNEKKKKTPSLQTVCEPVIALMLKDNH